MRIPSFNPEKNYLVYILDILEAIERILFYCQGIDEVAFSQDGKLQDAVIRRFQIIGEAAGRIPEEIRTTFPDIPWKKIVAQRNLIIHDYATVRPGEVWRVIQKDLPTLNEQLSKVKTYLEGLIAKKSGFS